LEQQDFTKNVNHEVGGLKIELVKRDFYNKLLPIFGKYKITKIQEINLSVEDPFLKIVYLCIYIKFKFLK